MQNICGKKNVYKCIVKIEYNIPAGWTWSVVLHEGSTRTVLLLEGSIEASFKSKKGISFVLNCFRFPLVAWIVLLCWILGRLLETTEALANPDACVGNVGEGILKAEKRIQLNTKKVKFMIKQIDSNVQISKPRIGKVWPEFWCVLTALKVAAFWPVGGFEACDVHGMFATVHWLL